MVGTRSSKSSLLFFPSSPESKTDSAPYFYKEEFLDAPSFGNVVTFLGNLKDVLITMAPDFMSCNVGIFSPSSCGCTIIYNHTSVTELT